MRPFGSSFRSVRLFFASFSSRGVGFAAAFSAMPQYDDNDDEEEDDDDEKDKAEEEEEGRGVAAET